MANTDTQENGICAWMASVRASMANDPCRQLFEDQVQTHAFIFLDDYLEHILAGPKQAPMIDLVKTPSRKRNIPRQARATTTVTAKVEKTALLSLDCDNSPKDSLPINNFHKALLWAKERSTQSVLGAADIPADSLSTSNRPAEKMHGLPKSVQIADIPQINISIESELQTDAMLLHHYSGNPPSESSPPIPAPERGSELSVIAEGDESPEHTHADTLPSSTIAFIQEELPEIIPRFFHEVEKFSTTEENPKGIPIDPKSLGDLSLDSSLISVYPIVPLDSLDSQPSEVTNHTDPLPSRTTIDSPRSHERNAFTAPLPVIPVSNSVTIPNTISVPLNDSSPGTGAPKSSTAGFPMLPAPSPLRKSVRVAQEVLTSSALPTPAPAPVPLGKRTSWLMKAREAKAMEGTGTLHGASAAATLAFPRVSTAVKRKSEEMLGGLSLEPDRDKDQRRLKVAKATEASIVPLIPKGTEKTKQSGSPLVPCEPITLSSTVAAMPVDLSGPHAMDFDEQITHLDSAEEGFIDLFKRTVEGLGARAGKSLGKSLGGAAVAALAEARAAAEAKVAERNKVNGESSDSKVVHDDGLPDQESLETQARLDDQLLSPQARRVERPLSLSDLGSETIQSNGLEFSVKIAQTTDVGTRVYSREESVSTTPPKSPRLRGYPAFVKPAGPVFNKPPLPPVFMPPASKQSSVASGQPREFPFNLQPGQLALPGLVRRDIPAKLTSPSNGVLPSLAREVSPIFVQPSQVNASSGPVINDCNGITTWDPSAQDTSYAIDSQQHDAQCAIVVEDDDDSWPLEEKLAAAEPGWRPFDFSNIDKEDTWSSLPTESQEPTESLTTAKNGDLVTSSNDTDLEAETNTEEAEREREIVEISDVECSTTEASELEGLAGAEMTSLHCVESTARTTSQTSMASTTSSFHSQTGFFSQATKLVNSMLGGGKKAKPELKSLQLAAAAAKKQQEEAEKKMQRLKDMEARRQVAIAKKAEEERTRLLEEEKKTKEELEKRKREREENTDRRPLKSYAPTKKAEDDTLKKRGLASETERKPESKKPAAKGKKDLGPPAKLAVTPTTKLAAQKGAKTTTALVSSTAYNATQNASAASSIKLAIPEAKPFKVVPSSLKANAKAKAKPQEDDVDDKPPFAIVQSQMAARAKVQMQVAKLPTPEVPSESIELPEINSEYSDSEDEERVRTFDPPDWAQSPELRQALQMQSTVNPDDIFGAVRPLRMEEIFRARQSRFRARTSSANWSGADRLTVEEIREYERRMGFQQTHTS